MHFEAPLNLHLEGGDASSGNLFLNERPVCDDLWELPAAGVACRSLGFPGAIAATTGSTFGQVTNRFLLSEVVCLGNETSLVECTRRVEGVHCGAGEGAGIICQGRPYTFIEPHQRNY